MKAARALALVLLVAGPAANAEDLGRLFLTPDQRAALDARRKARLPDKPTAVPATVSPTSRVDGFVQRAGGRSTVWVNGQAIAEDAPDAAARVGRSGTAVDLRIGEDGRAARAQVGQSVDSASGEIRDPMGDGEIRVKRAPAAPERRSR